MQMRTCNDCGKTAPEDQFSKNGRWYRNQCLECKRAYNRKDYEAHREKRIAQVTRWYEDHRDEKLEYAKEHYKANKAQYHKLAAESDKRLIAETFAFYGNKCACCGEAEPMFLTIDHVEGNGNKHRREVLGGFNKAGKATYRWLRQNGFPTGFQCLCQNCNVGKHRNKGICPHKARLRE
jgi:hypothetical protein